MTPRLAIGARSREDAQTPRWAGAHLVGCLLLLAAALIISGCARQARPDARIPPRLTADEVADLLPKKIPDREGWGLDVLTALDANRIHPSRENVCAVLAVIEQESGYRPNPVVPNLARIVQKKLDGYADKLGPLGRPALDMLLEGKAPGTRESFAARLKKVKTERDLDLVFRDLLRYYEEEFPTTFAAANLLGRFTGFGALAAQNPITTAGSMQVSVRFAMEHPLSRDLEEWQVRDRLYTRAGGVLYGSARLLDYEAAYDRPIYRFADYNAGFYASRNAAFQAQLAELTGIALALDGDLLIYEKDATPSRRDSKTLKALQTLRDRYRLRLSDRALRKDAEKEKSRAFEQTETWRALKTLYRQHKGTPAYARLPEVLIRSPKMRGDRSTAWFARSVDRRYQQCLQR